jgi:hypothetical protein
MTSSTEDPELEALAALGARGGQLRIPLSEFEACARMTDGDALYARMRGWLERYRVSDAELALLEQDNAGSELDPSPDLLRGLLCELESAARTQRAARAARASKRRRKHRKSRPRRR